MRFFGETPLAVYGLAILATDTGKQRYLDVAENVQKAFYAAHEKGDNPAGLCPGEQAGTADASRPKTDPAAGLGGRADCRVPRGPAVAAAQNLKPSCPQAQPLPKDPQAP